MYILIATSRPNMTAAEGENRIELGQVALPSFAMDIAREHARPDVSCSISLHDFQSATRAHVT